MITQKQVDQIINVGRVYIPDEKPFKQVFKKAFPPPDSSEWKELEADIFNDGDWTEEQRKFLRDHGIDI